MPTDETSIAPDDTPATSAPAHPEPVEGPAPSDIVQGPQPDEPVVAPPHLTEDPSPTSALGPHWRSLPPVEKIKLGLAQRTPIKQRRFPDWYQR